MKNERVDTIIGGIVVSGIIIAVMMLAPHPFPSARQLWYAAQTGHNWRNIVVVETSKPHDCDYGRAPLGSKECHFEGAVVIAPADNGTIVVEDVWTKIAD